MDVSKKRSAESRQHVKFLRTLVEVGMSILDKRCMKKLNRLLDRNQIEDAQVYLFYATYFRFALDRITRRQARSYFKRIGLSSYRMASLRRILYVEEQQTRAKAEWESSGERGALHIH